jgi:hypothetical protein
VVRCSFIPKFFITKLCKTKEGRRSADRRNVVASFARRARRRCRLQTLGRARLPALRRGTRGGERTPPLSSRRTSWDVAKRRALPAPACPSPANIVADRSSCRPGVFPKPPGSGVQIRPREPLSLRLQECPRGSVPSERDGEDGRNISSDQRQVPSKEQGHPLRVVAAGPEKHPILWLFTVPNKEGTVRRLSLFKTESF